MAAVPMQTRTRLPAIRSIPGASDDRVEFDPAEIGHGRHSDTAVPIGIAVLPLVAVVSVNLLMSLLILPRSHFSFWRSRVGRHLRSKGR